MSIALIPSSVTERDHVAGLGPLDGAVARLSCRYATYGLVLTEGGPATAEDLATAHSTWARRLGADARRPAWSLRFRR